MSADHYLRPDELRLREWMEIAEGYSDSAEFLADDLYQLLATGVPEMVYEIERLKGEIDK